MPGRQSVAAVIGYDALATLHRRKRAEKLRVLAMATVDQYAALMNDGGLEPEVAKADVLAISRAWRALLR